MSTRITRCLVILVAMLLSGCGGNKLVSVTITPATADAQKFPNGQVQFTAMGTYNNSPQPVPLAHMTWCVGSSNGLCNGNIASSATVDSNGVATCTGVLNGTATILAGTVTFATTSKVDGQLARGQIADTKKLVVSAEKNGEYLPSQGRTLSALPPITKRPTLALQLQQLLKFCRQDLQFLRVLLVRDSSDERSNTLFVLEYQHNRPRFEQPGKTGEGMQ